MFGITFERKDQMEPFNLIVEEEFFVQSKFIQVRRAA